MFRHQKKNVLFKHLICSVDKQWTVKKKTRSGVRRKPRAVDTDVFKQVARVTEIRKGKEWEAVNDVRRGDLVGLVWDLVELVWGLDGGGGFADYHCAAGGQQSFLRVTMKISSIVRHLRAQTTSSCLELIDQNPIPHWPLPFERNVPKKNG